MNDLIQQIESWIQSRQLIRLSLLEKGIGRKVLHGRILQYSASEQLILFYHDDEKKVYNLALSEIEDLEASSNPKEDKQEQEKSQKNHKKNNQAVQDPEREKLLEETLTICQCLSKEELSRILPLLKLIHQKKEK